MATPKQLDEYREKAVLSPNTGKHGPRKSTLLKREAEERYIEKLVEEFEPILKVHLEEAKKPGNVTERLQAIKTILGTDEEKKGDKHIHLHQHSELSEESKKLIEEYEQKLKELKTK